MDNKHKSLDNNECALDAAQERLEHDSYQVLTVQRPDERHLACALLAWQSLGHNNAGSLHRFVEAKLKENQGTALNKLSNKKVVCASSSNVSLKTESFTTCTGSSVLRCADSTNFGNCCLMGPVVLLPVETKTTIMRLEAPDSSKKPTDHRDNKSTMSKIDKACCLESACAERLAQLGTETEELRARADKLARREAERVALVQRAEAAWKELEAGYRRRLANAEHKQNEFSKQIQDLMQERINDKNTCATMVVEIRDRGDAVTRDRAQLAQLERQLCDRACVRNHLSKESAQSEAALTQQQCKVAQYERELEFKEEQIRRKFLNLESEVDSARALTLDAERAMRAELGALQEQIKKTSKQLLQEDTDINRIKTEVEKLRSTKLQMVNEFDGCKDMCDKYIKAGMDDLIEVQAQLQELRDRVTECQCKVPIDATVTAKRTPSLAALCRCTKPEDRKSKTCSCTSLRQRMLSNLLEDLFEGLKDELDFNVAQMSCQLLKGLSDKHDWDRASVVKSNLRNFFAKLLVGELDIAIATAIENYHVTWVGESCADKKRTRDDLVVQVDEEWEQRAVQKRAKEIAPWLAEKMFEEQADKLVQRARDIIAAAPVPCKCEHTFTQEPAVFSCLLEPYMAGGGQAAATVARGDEQSTTNGVKSGITVNGRKSAIVAIGGKSLAASHGKAASYLSGNKAAPAYGRGKVAPDFGSGKAAADFSGGKAARDFSGGKATTDSGGGKAAPDFDGSKASPDLSGAEAAPTYGGSKAAPDFSVGKAAPTVSNGKTAVNPPIGKDSKALNPASGGNVTAAPSGRKAVDAASARAVLATGDELVAAFEERFVGGSGGWTPDSAVSVTWFRRRTLEDVTQLKAQIENLKKESIKKEDLLLMENKIVEILARASSPIRDDITKTRKNINSVDDSRKEIRRPQIMNTGRRRPFSTNKLSSYQKQMDEVKNCPKNINRFRQNPNLPYKQPAKNYKRGNTFAVNVCLYDSQRNSYKSKQGRMQKKITSEDDIGAWTPKDMLSQSSCLKQAKPIGQELSQECIIVEHEDSKTSIQTSCPSGCVCFNKTPSNTSIDNLLKTLTKWKSDLIGSPADCHKDSQKTVRLVNDLAEVTKDIIKNKTKLHQTRETEDLKLKINAIKTVSKNTNNESMFSNNLSSQMVDNKNGSLSELPALNDSEYMGATNLEKSNENFCKCVMECSKENFNILEQNNFPIKCIKTCNCHNNKPNEIRNRKLRYFRNLSKNGLQVREDKKPQELRIKPNKIEFDKNKPLIGDFENTQLLQKEKVTTLHTKPIFSSKNLENNEATSNLTHIEIKADVKAESLKDKNKSVHMPQRTTINTPEVFPSDLDYKIKFLGVTLTDATPINKKDENTEYVINDLQRRTNVPPTRTKDPLPTELHEHWAKAGHSKAMDRVHKHKSNRLNSNDLTSSRSTCPCDTTFDQLRKIFDNSLDKEYGDCLTNIDKALDTESLKESKSEKQEPCVCCDSKDGKVVVKESNDLEINTFELLEEHLKEKIKELKRNCNSSCIPPEEESKLFSTIIQKLQQFITSNISNVTCNCSERQAVGSWNRAYSMLHEYLETKIKRVQCMCASQKECKETILSDLMNKVSNLIQDDFQRLKEICKCRKEKTLQETKSTEEQRYTNNINSTESGTKTLDIVDSKIYHQQNISSQVSANLGKDSKSCDAMVKKNKSKGSFEFETPKSYIYQTTQTELKHETLPDTCFYFCQSGICNCSSILSKEKLLNTEQLTTNENLFDQGTDFPEINKDYTIVLTPAEKEDPTFLSIDENIIHEVLGGGEDHLSKHLKQEHHSSDQIKDIKILDSGKATIPYIGYTVNCSCDRDLGSCVCTKSLVRENNEKINSIWKSFASNKRSNDIASYLMDSLNNNNDNINYSDVAKDSNTTNIKTVYSRTKGNSVNSMNINASVSEEMVLKDSREKNISPRNNTTNTSNSNDNSKLTVISPTETVNNFNDDSRDRIERDKRKQPGTQDQRTTKKCVRFPKYCNAERTKSDGLVHSSKTRLPKSLTPDCKCDLVPICHVKMLMENIENRLVNSNCTCDSLSANVCPVHSKATFVGC